MRKRAIAATLVVTLSLTFLSPLLSLRVGIGNGSPTTTLSVQPAGTAGITPGQLFSINITVSNVSDLYAWQFYLYYQSSVLNGTSIDQGPFLTVPSYFIITDFTDNYNATHGYMYVSCTRVGNVSGVNGDGTLATVTFKAVGAGSSILHLDNTRLTDSTHPFGNLIPHTLVDGWAYVGNVHVTVNDIATPINIPQGAMAYINVTAQNRGGLTETFDVTLYDDQTPIETKTAINLTPGQIETLNFTWDTTPVPVGEYTLNATATQVPGETDLSDHNVTTKVYVGTRDIAATAISPSRTSVPIEYLPGGINVSVTVKNNGQATETFNVTMYYGVSNVSGQNTVATQTTALASGGSQTLTFTWNTSTLGYANYTLLAHVNPLPYDTNTADKNQTVIVTVTIPGDVNGDGVVNILDAIQLANAFLARPGDPNWNPNADINGDNDINILDAILLANNFLAHI
jgi:hypothetical protein